MTIADTYRETAEAIALHKRQDELVGEALVRLGELDRDHLYNVGLDGCGRIKNPGGRIHELRAKGWNIKTDTDRVPGKCFYVLVSKPDGMMPDRETGPSFAGFGRYLSRRGIAAYGMTDQRRTELYQEYCEELRRA